MQSKYIMTAFGKDRPGIVADVTELLYENGCNLEDTTMSMLSDEFTINLLFSSSTNGIEATLQKESKKLEQEKNISAFIRPLKASSAVAVTKLPLCTIHVEGLDQAGIVYKISKYLADNKLNIVDLKSSVKTTPESGTALYMMDIHIQLPPGASINGIESDLNFVAEEINVEITVTP
jgi:glycine cleavage system transcriptional repressor